MKINGQNVCIGCMKPLDSKGGCSFCGMIQEEYNPIPRCLMPGTKLEDRYILGKVLGEGSFGITYIGWDTYMEIPVAVKEYFPSEMVSRDVICGTGNSVYLYENSRKNRYHDDLKKFLEEARCLSRFNHVKGIVSVLDFFYENNTAYIVMQYIDGVSVKEYVNQNGKIPEERVMETIGPVLLALEQVHQTGIVHRDISPDNIMIKKDGSLVLIDFGAARMRNLDNTKTMTVLFKRGFSPEEQYRYKGRWGAYTDVYSISATIYFMLTGTPPTDSVIRALGDDMPSLVSMKELRISMRQKKAIMKGMAVNAANRWQSVGELYEALYDEGGTDRISNDRKKRTAVVVCLLLLVSALVLGGEWIVKRDTKVYGETVARNVQKAELFSLEEKKLIPDLEIEEKKITVPRLTGLSAGQAKKKLKKIGLKCKIKRIESRVEKGTVLAQSVDRGKETDPGKTVTITVSKGEKTRTQTPSPSPKTTGNRDQEQKSSEEKGDFAGVIR